jgi:hypothetical protein
LDWIGGGSRLPFLDNEQPPSTNGSFCSGGRSSSRSIRSFTNPDVRSSASCTWASTPNSLSTYHTLNRNNVASSSPHSRCRTSTGICGMCIPPSLPQSPPLLSTVDCSERLNRLHFFFLFIILSYSIGSLSRWPSSSWCHWRGTLTVTVCDYKVPTASAVDLSVHRSGIVPAIQNIVATVRPDSDLASSHCYSHSRYSWLKVRPARHDHLSFHWCLPIIHMCGVS